MNPELKIAIDGIGTAFSDYRSTNDERLAAIEKGDTARATELDTKLAKMDSDVSKFQQTKAEIERLEAATAEQKERIEDLESRQTGPQLTAADKLNAEHATKFEAAIRGGLSNNDLNTALKQHERSMIAAKAVTIGTPSAGGYAVPEQIAAMIEKLERKLSPVRDLVKVVQIGTSDYKELIDIGGIASGWVGEGGTRSETATSALREIVPTHGELYAYPQASEWSLDDMFFDVSKWLAESVAEEFAYQEGIAVISGNGTSKPTGMLNTDPLVTADAASPLRSAVAYQYIASAASPSAITADSILDLIYGLNSKYRSAAKFTMNSTTAGIVRKLKDTTNQYLWSPGLAAGEPDKLLNYDHVSWEDMEDVATDAHPIAFGNFNRGYLLVDRVTMRVTVDQVTTPGFIKYYMRRREGGIVLNNDAIKFMKTT